MPVSNNQYSRPNDDARKFRDQQTAQGPLTGADLDETFNDLADGINAALDAANPILFRNRAWVLNGSSGANAGAIVFDKTEYVEGTEAASLLAVGDPFSSIRTIRLNVNAWETVDWSGTADYSLKLELDAAIREGADGMILIRSADDPDTATVDPIERTEESIRMRIVGGGIEDGVYTLYVKDAGSHGVLGANAAGGRDPNVQLWKLELQPEGAIHPIESSVELDVAGDNTFEWDVTEAPSAHVTLTADAEMSVIGLADGGRYSLLLADSNGHALSFHSTSMLPGGPLAITGDANMLQVAVMAGKVLWNLVTETGKSIGQGETGLTTAQATAIQAWNYRGDWTNVGAGQWQEGDVVLRLLVDTGDARNDGLNNYVLARCGVAHNKTSSPDPRLTADSSDTSAAANTARIYWFPVGFHHGAPDSVVDVSVSGSTLTKTFRDGRTETETLPAGGGDIPQKASQADVDTVAVTGADLSASLASLDTAGGTPLDDSDYLSLKKAVRLLNRVLKTASSTVRGAVLLARNADVDGGGGAETSRVPTVALAIRLFNRLIAPVTTQIEGDITDSLSLDRFKGFWAAGNYGAKDEVAYQKTDNSVSLFRRRTAGRDAAGDNPETNTTDWEELSGRDELNAQLHWLASGMAKGGTRGQHLVKASDRDFDTEWITAATGGGGYSAFHVKIADYDAVKATDKGDMIWMQLPSAQTSNITLKLPSLAQGDAGWHCGVYKHSESNHYGTVTVTDHGGTVLSRLHNQGEFEEWTWGGGYWHRTSQSGEPDSIPLRVSAPQWSTLSGTIRKGTIVEHNGFPFLAKQEHTKGGDEGNGPDGDPVNWWDLDSWWGVISQQAYYPEGALAKTGAGTTLKIWMASEFVHDTDPLPTAANNVKWKQIWPSAQDEPALRRGIESFLGNARLRVVEELGKTIVINPEDTTKKTITLPEVLAAHSGAMLRFIIQTGAGETADIRVPNSGSIIEQDGTAVTTLAFSDEHNGHVIDLEVIGADQWRVTNRFPDAPLQTSDARKERIAFLQTGQADADGTNPYRVFAIGSDAVTVVAGTGGPEFLTGVDTNPNNPHWTVAANVYLVYWQGRVRTREGNNQLRIQIVKESDDAVLAESSSTYLRGNSATHSVTKLMVLHLDADTEVKGRILADTGLLNVNGAHSLTFVRLTGDPTSVAAIEESLETLETQVSELLLRELNNRPALPDADDFDAGELIVVDDVWYELKSNSGTKSWKRWEDDDQRISQLQADIGAFHRAITPDWQRRTAGAGEIGAYGLTLHNVKAGQVYDVEAVVNIPDLPSGTYDTQFYFGVFYDANNIGRTIPFTGDDFHGDRAHAGNLGYIWEDANGRFLEKPETTTGLRPSDMAGHVKSTSDNTTIKTAPAQWEAKRDNDSVHIWLYAWSRLTNTSESAIHDGSGTFRAVHGFSIAHPENAIAEDLATLKGQVNYHKDLIGTVTSAGNTLASRAWTIPTGHQALISNVDRPGATSGTDWLEIPAVDYMRWDLGYDGIVIESERAGAVENPLTSVKIPFHAFKRPDDPWSAGMWQNTDSDDKKIDAVCEQTGSKLRVRLHVGSHDNGTTIKVYLAS